MSGPSRRCETTTWSKSPRLRESVKPWRLVGNVPPLWRSSREATDSMFFSTLVSDTTVRSDSGAACADLRTKCGARSGTYEEQPAEQNGGTVRLAAKSILFEYKGVSHEVVWYVGDHLACVCVCVCA